MIITAEGNFFYEFNFFYELENNGGMMYYMTFGIFAGCNIRYVKEIIDARENT